MKFLEKNMSFALEPTVHFLSEKRSEAYKKYGEVSIAGEKCAGGQELLPGDWLCRATGERGAEVRT